VVCPRIKLPVGAALVAAWGFAWGATAVSVEDATARAKSRACFPKGSYTYAATHRARLFSRDVPAGAMANDATRVYGCLFRTGRRVLLERVFEDESLKIQHVRFAGPFVAYAIETCLEPGLCDMRAVAANLRDPGVRQHPTAPATDLELSPRGNVAWISQSGSDLRVHLDGAVIDAARDIEPTSLAMSGSVLYWTRGGQPQSIRLGP
jgi:hypothetical protein